MRTELRQLIRDVKAAVLLQQPEAIDIALSGLLGLPGVAANDYMNDGFIAQVILPMGEILSALPTPLLQPLLSHSLVVGRALGAVALGYRYVKNGDVRPTMLFMPGSDPRTDVRVSLGRGLAACSRPDPGRIFELGEKWISSPSPRVRHTALTFLPALVEKHASKLLDLLDPLMAEEDRDVKGALVDALTTLGATGFAAEVLNLLKGWSANPDSSDWVICRALSASWAASYPVEVTSILQTISNRFGRTKSLSNAIKALRRHGLDIHLESGKND